MTLITMAIDTNDLKRVWVFNGARNHFPSAVFTERRLAEAWIQKNQLEGTLTAYPLNISIYDWAIDKDVLLRSKRNRRPPVSLQTSVPPLRNTIILRRKRR